MSKKIRIVEALNSLGLGGTEYVMQLFCKYFDKDLFDVTVVAFYEGGPREAILADMGINVEVLHGDQDKFANILKDADVLHWHGSGRFDEKVFSVIEKSKPKLVIQTNVFGKMDKNVNYYRLVDYDLYVSKMCLVRRMRKDGRTGTRYAAKRKVLYNPVDVGYIQQNLPSREEVQSLKEKLGLTGCFVAGRIGRADDNKFDLITIDAIARLKSKIPDLKFLLVGATDKIRTYAERLGLSGNMVYVEPTANFRELLKIYCALDVFVAASAIGESFGMVIAEAMACGVPVVTISTPARDNGQVELVDNGRTGFVVERHVPSMANAILRLHDDRDLRQLFAQASKTKVAESFEAANIVQSLQDLVLNHFSQSKKTRCGFKLLFDWNTELKAEYRNRTENVFGDCSMIDKVVIRSRELLSKL